MITTGPRTQSSPGSPGVAVRGAWFVDVASGRLEWTDGSFYEGHFAHGLREGQGKYVCEGGLHVYEGAWKDSKKHGAGVETWPNGPGKMPSACRTRFPVENVDAMDFGRVAFTTRHDHSKWAVALDRHRPYACVGDINRMQSQRKRGGGTLCVANEALWKVYTGAVAKIEACPKN